MVTVIIVGKAVITAMDVTDFITAIVPIMAPFSANRCSCQ